MIRLPLAAIIIACLLSALICHAAPVELLANGGFEWGNWEWSSGWGHLGHEIVRDQSHSGEVAMYFSAAGSVRTMRYDYAGGPVQVSGWYRLQDVKQGEKPWYRFWVTLEFSDATGKGLGHVDCAAAHGTVDWTRWERTVATAPEGTTAISVSVSLHNTTGEAWVDDVQITADARLDWPAWKFTEKPYYTGQVFPTPKQSSYGETIPIWDAGTGRDTLRVELGASPDGPALFGADRISQRLAACERFLRFNTPADAEPERVRIHLGRLDDEHVQRAARMMGVDLPEALGPQGHLVRMIERNGLWEVLAAGVDDKGVVYAAASIVQMIGIRDSALVLRSFDLRDEPTWPLRAGGDYGPVGEEMLAMLAMCKLPVYSMQHRMWWRLAEPDGPNPGKTWPYARSLARMRDWCERTGAMDLMFLIHIYTPGSRPTDDTGPIFDITNEQDIADLTERLKWLYDMGQTIQMVCVDDYVGTSKQQYICKTDAEQERFGHIGRAHGYLMRRLWDSLAPECPDLKLSFVTGPYSTSHLGRQVTEEDGRRYLREMDEEMPPDVAVVWTGARITSPTITREDWQHYQSLVPGQPLYVWDNNEGLLPIPGFNASFYPGMHRDSAWGLMYLNAHYVGWPHTLPAHLAANDCLWNPAGYDAQASHEQAVAKAYGEVDYEDVRTINDGFLDARAMIRGTGFDQERLLSTVTDIYASLERLDDAGVSTSVSRRQLSSAGVVPALAERLAAIPEVTVPRLDAAPEVDGSLADEQWQQAVRLGAFEHYQTSETWSFEGNLHATDCMVLRAGDALYIAGSCSHEGIQLKPHAEAGRRDAPVYFHSDAVEVFLMPDPKLASYAHMALDHTGTVFDEMPKGRADWDGDWQWAVAQEDGVWHFEMRVPFEALGVAAPAPGEKWRASLCRSLGQGEQQYSAWSRVYGSFHNWPFWGWLVFE